MIKIFNADESTSPVRKGFSFRDAQEVVGGTVEIVNLPSGDVMLVNEDGPAIGLPFNVTAFLMSAKPILGNVVVLTGKDIGKILH